MNFVVQKVIHESSYAYNLCRLKSVKSEWEDLSFEFRHSSRDFLFERISKMFFPLFSYLQNFILRLQYSSKSLKFDFFLLKILFLIRYARLCDVELNLYIKLVYKWSRNAKIYPESFWTVARLFRYCCCFRVQLCWECGTWLICRNTANWFVSKVVISASPITK
jgi:hypothetical protein